MKRVLIIVYYWPPTGGSGVQRWVKFVKHLRSFGWEPVIYTPLNPYVQEGDDTLLKDIPEGIEVLKTPVLEVSKFFGTHNPSGLSTLKPSLFSIFKKQAGNFIRANFFIPDPRVLWVKPSVKFLSAYLKEHSINVIVSSGPPHSVHLIAKQIASRFNIPWLADFRDPWVEMVNFHGFKPSAAAFSKNLALFKGVIQSANGIITAHPGVAEKFKSQTDKKVTLITNGYDADDFKVVQDANLDRSKFNLVFVGVFYAIRNIPVFWEAINELANENLDFRYHLNIIFVGNVHQEVLDSLQDNNLIQYCEFKGYVDHAAAVAYQAAADVLLLSTPLLEEFRYEIPGKLFEYLAVRKPIICVADVNNDAAQILLKTKAGYVVHPRDKIRAKHLLLQLYMQHCRNELNVNPQGIEQYERKNLTAAMAAELNKASTKL